MKTLSFILIFIIMITQSTPAQQKPSLVGDWKGTIDANVPLLIETHFQKHDDGSKGTLTIQGHNLLLQHIDVADEDSVHFEFQSGNGLATFKGSIESDSSIAGKFLQKGYTFPFKLNRYEADTMAIEAKPLPYHHKDLIIKNDSINIGGTLTWPEEEQAKQLVIMISGSGAQDRDEATPVTDFKPFAELADSLTVSGMATFRYDDRGIGESTGNFANAILDMLASDVEAIINYFENKSDKKFNQIILLGHSQGGIVAGKVAAEDTRVDKLILMASPGISLKKVLHYQVKQGFLSGGVADSTAENEITARENLMDALRKNKNIEEAQKKYHDKFKAIQILAGADSTQAKMLADRQSKVLLQGFKTPQMQSLLFYNPAKDLQQITIPALVIFGGKDTQVPVKLNKVPSKGALEKAGVKYKIEIFENANHLFQKANTGQVQEFGKLENEFVDGFLSTTKQWIQK